MVEPISAGATIGYIALILLRELDWKGCRLCTVFWLSIAYCLLFNDWLPLGIVNLVAHCTYLALIRVAYDVP